MASSLLDNQARFKGRLELREDLTKISKELRIERIKKVREQSHRIAEERNQIFREEIEKCKYERYLLKKKAKEEQLLKNAEKLNSAWSEALVQSGAAHREALSRQENAGKQKQAADAVAKRQQEAAERRMEAALKKEREQQEQLKRREREKLILKHLRDQERMANREDAHAYQESKVAVNIVAKEEAERVRLIAQSAERVHHRFPTKITPTVTRHGVFIHDELGRVISSPTAPAVVNDAARQEVKTRKELWSNIMKEMKRRRVVKERATEARYKNFQATSAETLEEELKLLYKLDKDGARATRLKESTNVPPVDANAQMIRTSFEKVFMNGPPDGVGVESPAPVPPSSASLREFIRRQRKEQKVVDTTDEAAELDEDGVGQQTTQRGAFWVDMTKSHQQKQQHRQEVVVDQDAWTSSSLVSTDVSAEGDSFEEEELIRTIVPSIPQPQPPAWQNARHPPGHKVVHSEVVNGQNNHTDVEESSPDTSSILIDEEDNPFYTNNIYAKPPVVPPTQPLTAFSPAKEDKDLIVFDDSEISDERDVSQSSVEHVDESFADLPMTPSQPQQPSRNHAQNHASTASLSTSGASSSHSSTHSADSSPDESVEAYEVMDEDSLSGDAHVLEQDKSDVSSSFDGEKEDGMAARTQRPASMSSLDSSANSSHRSASSASMKSGGSSGSDSGSGILIEINPSPVGYGYPSYQQQQQQQHSLRAKEGSVSSDSSLSAEIVPDQRSQQLLQYPSLSSSSSSTSSSSAMRHQGTQRAQQQEYSAPIGQADISVSTTSSLSSGEIERYQAVLQSPKATGAVSTVHTKPVSVVHRVPTTSSPIPTLSSAIDMRAGLNNEHYDEEESEDSLAYRAISTTTKQNQQLERQQRQHYHQQTYAATALRQSATADDDITLSSDASSSIGGDLLANILKRVASATEEDGEGDEDEEKSFDLMAALPMRAQQPTQGRNTNSNIAAMATVTSTTVQTQPQPQPQPPQPTNVTMSTLLLDDSDSSAELDRQIAQYASQLDTSSNISQRLLQSDVDDNDRSRDRARNLLDDGDHSDDSDVSLLRAQQRSQLLLAEQSMDEDSLSGSLGDLLRLQEQKEQPFRVSSQQQHNSLLNAEGGTHTNSSHFSISDSTLHPEPPTTENNNIHSSNDSSYINLLNSTFLSSSTVAGGARDHGSEIVLASSRKARHTRDGEPGESLEDSAAISGSLSSQAADQPSYLYTGSNATLGEIQHEIYAMRRRLLQAVSYPQAPVTQGSLSAAALADDSSVAPPPLGQDVMLTGAADVSSDDSLVHIEREIQRRKDEQAAKKARTQVHHATASTTATLSLNSASESSSDSSGFARALGQRHQQLAKGDDADEDILLTEQSLSSLSTPRMHRVEQSEIISSSFTRTSGVSAGHSSGVARQAHQLQSNQQVDMSGRVGGDGRSTVRSYLSPPATTTSSSHARQTLHSSDEDSPTFGGMLATRSSTAYNVTTAQHTSSSSSAQEMDPLNRRVTIASERHNSYHSPPMLLTEQTPSPSTPSHLLERGSSLLLTGTNRSEVHRAEHKSHDNNDRHLLQRTQPLYTTSSASSSSVHRSTNNNNNLRTQSQSQSQSQQQFPSHTRQDNSILSDTQRFASFSTSVLRGGFAAEETGEVDDSDLDLLAVLSPTTTRVFPTVRHAATTDTTTSRPSNATQHRSGPDPLEQTQTLTRERNNYTATTTTSSSSASYTRTTTTSSGRGMHMSAVVAVSGATARRNDRRDDYDDDEDEDDEDFEQDLQRTMQYLREQESDDEEGGAGGYDSSDFDLQEQSFS